MRNIVNGHRYVGVTSKSIAKRRAAWRYDSRSPQHSPLAEALAHFGDRAFEWMVIGEYEDQDEALRTERDLTRVLRPEYNQVFGGGGRAPYLHKAQSAAPLKRLPDNTKTVLSLPDEEEWRPIAGYEAYYEVSSHGRVRSVPRMVRRRGIMWRMPGRVLIPQVDRKTGRHSASLSVDGKVRKTHISILVARAFLGERPKGYEVCHLSDDKHDNKINNLYYGTHQQNCDDRSRNGKTMRGERATGVKLTEANVREIKLALAVPGLQTQRDIAALYGVSREAISRIACGKNWAHVGE